MQARKSLIWFIALVAASSLLVACGGAAEEPAPEAAEPEAAPTEPEAAPVAVEPEPEPQAPPEPQLEGTITLTNDDFGWLTSGSRTEAATYWWTLRVTNDTTQNLDITVRFEFLDDNDDVVKAEFKTVRLAPAASTTIREEGEMSHADSLRFAAYTYSFDWAIASN